MSRKPFKVGEIEDKVYELEIKYHRLLSKICTILKTELPLNLDDSALDDF